MLSFRRDHSGGMLPQNALRLGDLVISLLVPIKTHTTAVMHVRPSGHTEPYARTQFLLPSLPPLFARTLRVR